MKIERLVIIGNGFDLAHGLKSNCEHFIIHYLSKIWANLSIGNYEDRLVNIRSSKDYFRENDLNFDEKNAVKIFKNIVVGISYKTNEPHLIFKSNFFKAIFTKISDLNWADIESEYFNELIYILDSSKRAEQRASDRISLEQSTLKKIESLNNDLDYLKTVLISYLSDEEAWFAKEGEIDNEFKTFFTEGIFEGEKRAAKYNPIPERTVFLNFNYTNLLQKYIDEQNIIYIHGTLGNNPIFGFGDDTSERYRMIEDFNINETLKKIKSFKYPTNGNYSKLLNFISVNNYQVHIFGHSCGISDRTLFKQILESERCQSVKIFYYDENDFNEKLYELSRHFGNKNEFLKKIVPFDSLRKVPQPKKLLKTAR